MSRLRSLLELTADEWLRALKLSREEIPLAVIVEGSWWRAQRVKWRTSYLTDVRELEFPDIFWGRRHGKPVVFACAYGAPRNVELIHLFGILGAKLAIQIGTCGGLQPQLVPGDILVPHTAVWGEGAIMAYGNSIAPTASVEWVERARHQLTSRNYRSYSGWQLTWSALFAQTGAMIEEWQSAGFLGVDMETASTFAVSRYFNMPTVSMLVVWDALTRNRSFLDPLTVSEQAALDRGNESIYEVALELVAQIP